MKEIAKAHNGHTQNEVINTKEMSSVDNSVLDIFVLRADKQFIGTG